MQPYGNFQALGGLGASSIASSDRDTNAITHAPSSNFLQQRRNGMFRVWTKCERMCIFAYICTKKNIELSLIVPNKLHRGKNDIKW
jgi:hypothetical protein